MKTTVLRLTMAAVAAAVLAACGGGGSSSPTPATPAKAGSGSTLMPQANGSTRLTVTYHKSTASTTASARKHVAKFAKKQATFVRKTAGAKRSPQYVGENTNGMQVTVTVGTTPTTYFIDLDTSQNSTCTENNDAVTCNLSVPTLGPVESIKVLDVDQEPTQPVDPNTGISTATNPSFPAGTAVLASGQTTDATGKPASVTLTPGGISNISISLNPVVGLLADCGGFDDTSNNMEFDYSVNPQRITITGNVASVGSYYQEVTDMDGREVEPTIASDGSTILFQPLSDVDGTLVPITATSSIANLTLFAQKTGISDGLPPPTGGYSGSPVSFPTTQYLGDGELDLAMRWDGFGSPSATGGTLTLTNNLVAVPPNFSGPALTGPPPCCGPFYPLNPPTTNYASPITVVIAPLFLTSSAATVAENGTLTLTGYDPGSPRDMDWSDCYDGNSNDLGSVTSNGSLASGMQTFTLTAGATPGVCTVTLYDDWTGTPSNPINITIHA